MKQVIFLCLLSLTLCLSKPAEPDVPPNHAANKVADAKVEKANEPTAANPVQTAATSAQTPVAPVQTQATPQQSAPAQQPPQSDTHPETQKPNTITTTDSNKTTEKKEDPKTKPTEGTKVEPPTPANTHTDVKPATNSETKPKDKPEEGAKIITSTPVPVTPKPTDAPKTEEPKTNVTPKDEDKHIVQARGFDGPSFMGGIILSLGLLAIGFMGFKYYKNQTERNYHTL